MHERSLKARDAAEDGTLFPTSWARPTDGSQTPTKAHSLRARAGLKRPRSVTQGTVWPAASSTCRPSRDEPHFRGGAPLRSFCFSAMRTVACTETEEPFNDDGAVERTGLARRARKAGTYCLTGAKPAVGPSSGSPAPRVLSCSAVDVGTRAQWRPTSHAGASLPGDPRQRASSPRLLYVRAGDHASESISGPEPNSRRSRRSGDCVPR